MTGRRLTAQGTDWRIRNHWFVLSTFLLAVALVGCGGSSGSSQGTDSTAVSTDKIEELKKSIDDARANAWYSLSQMPNGNVFATNLEERVRTALLDAGLYSKVRRVPPLSAFSYSRNLCGKSRYDTLLAALRPAKVSGVGFVQTSKPKKGFLRTSVEVYAFMDVDPDQLVELFANFSDTVAAEGSTCDTTIRVGGPNPQQCPFEKVEPSFPGNWYQESDYAGTGCKLGSYKVPATSLVDKGDDDIRFTSPFSVLQLATDKSQIRLAKAISIQPQNTLRTVFVVEVISARDDSTRNASSSPTLTEVGQAAAKVSGAVAGGLATQLQEAFSLSELIAKDVAYSAASG